MVTDNRDNITIHSKYECSVPFCAYTYQDNQKEWKGYFTYLINYQSFRGLLIYHNFEIHLRHDYYLRDVEHYEMNPMPDDQVIPALKPQIPPIPNVHSVKFKHYYIVQDKSTPERYTLFLFEYEPAILKAEVDNQRPNSYTMTGYHKYNEELRCHKYSYVVGKNEWDGGKSAQTYLHSIFSSILIYNNFALNFGNTHYERNPMPNDQLVPSLELSFPDIPNEHINNYKHYCIVQDKKYLEIWAPSFLMIERYVIVKYSAH